METSLPTPMTARVYVNLPEGTNWCRISQPSTVMWPLTYPRSAVVFRLGSEVLGQLMDVVATSEEAQELGRGDHPGR